MSLMNVSLFQTTKSKIFMNKTCMMPKKLQSSVFLERINQVFLG